MLYRTRAQLFLWSVVFTAGCTYCDNIVTAQTSGQKNYVKDLLYRQNRGTSSSFFSVDRIKQRNQFNLVPTAGVSGLNRKTFSSSLASSSSSTSQRKKPFRGVTRGPAVSPYLSLSRPFGSATDYQTLVRPMREQQRQQEQMQRYTIQNQRRLNQMAARAPYNTRGDENAAPTGHAAVFQSLGSYQNTGNYFPPPSRPKQR